MKLFFVHVFRNGEFTITFSLLYCLHVLQRRKSFSRQTFFVGFASKMFLKGLRSKNNEGVNYIAHFVRRKQPWLLNTILHVYSFAN